MSDRGTTRRTFLCAAAGLALGVRPPALLGASPIGQPGDEVSWLAEAQRRPEKLPADAPRLAELLDDGEGGRIDSLATWKRRRGALRDAWLDLLGPLSRAKRAVPAPKVLASDRVREVVRELVRYPSEGGEPVEAYLLKPAKDAGRRPGTVVFHSTVNHSIRQPAGVEGSPEKAFGLELARRGHVALCPRNFLWPANDRIAADEEARRFRARHPDSTGMARMLYDALLAVDILTARPDVDPERVAAVGHSLGAKEVLYLAALDERVRVAVSSEGGVGIRFSNWDAPWYLGATCRGADFGHEHHELLALAAPRAFLLVGGDSADGDRSWPFIEAALPVYRLYGGAARLGLYNHRGGHAVPKEAERRIYEWIDAYL